jgi:hypothetical protein
VLRSGEPEPRDRLVDDQPRAPEQHAAILLIPQEGEEVRRVSCSSGCDRCPGSRFGRVRALPSWPADQCKLTADAAGCEMFETSQGYTSAWLAGKRNKPQRNLNKPQRGFGGPSSCGFPWTAPRAEPGFRAVARDARAQRRRARLARAFRNRAESTTNRQALWLSISAAREHRARVSIRPRWRGLALTWISRRAWNRESNRQRIDNRIDNSPSDE